MYIYFDSVVHDHIRMRMRMLACLSQCLYCLLQQLHACIIIISQLFSSPRGIVTLSPGGVLEHSIRLNQQPQSCVGLCDFDVGVRWTGCLRMHQHIGMLHYGQGAKCGFDLAGGGVHGDPEGDIQLQWVGAKRDGLALGPVAAIGGPSGAGWGHFILVPTLRAKVGIVSRPICVRAALIVLGTPTGRRCGTCGGSRTPCVRIRNTRRGGGATAGRLEEADCAEQKKQKRKRQKKTETCACEVWCYLSWHRQPPVECWHTVD